MEENYEMKDFPYDEQLPQDLEENDETEFIEENDKENYGKAKQIDALSAAIRERKNEFAEYRDLLLKQRAVLRLLKEENTRLKKNLIVSNRQSYDKSVKVSKEIITPLREELIRQKEATSRMLESVNRGNHILNRQREIINKQSKVIDALEKENKTLRDAEWIKMENTELKKNSR